MRKQNDMKKQFIFMASAIVLGVCLARVPAIINRFGGGEDRFFEDCIWTEIDFEVSMRADEFQQSITSDATRRQTGVPGRDLMTFFKDLYDKNAPWRLQANKQARIPKIIHQIWIGPEVPKEFEQFQQSWKEAHPDWEYKLWTQHDLKDLQLENQDLIAQSRNPAEISDLMRYEILYRMGGVYIDFDYECLRPLDVLNHMYDFYIGIQPLDSDSVQLGSGLIGAVPGHPILNHMISAAREAWTRTQDIPNRTGPALFTRSFIACADQAGNIDVAFPASYLYPMGCQETKVDKVAWLNNDAFAVHYWAKSWLTPSFRRPEFQGINNRRS